jgi:hypothetical protein
VGYKSFDRQIAPIALGCIGGEGYKIEKRPFASALEFLKLFFYWKNETGKSRKSPFGAYLK